MLKFFRSSLLSQGFSALFLGLSLSTSAAAQTEQTAIDFILNEAASLTTTDDQVDNGRYVDIHEIEVAPNEDLVVLLASDEFDTYLFVFDEEWNKVAENDDFQGTTHSGLLLKNESGGTYNIVSTSREPEQLGQYFLTVRKTTIQEKTTLKGNEFFEVATALYEEGSADSLRQAQTNWLEALMLYRQAEDGLSQARTLNKLGFVADRLGEKDLALSRYTESLDLYQTLGDRRGEALAINNIGHVYSTTGDKQAALEYYTRSLELLREIGDRRWQGSTLNNIGAVHAALGNQAEALAYYEESLPILQEMENKSGEARTLSNMAAIYDILGERQQAIDFLEKALPILQEIGDRGGEATALNNLGTVYDDLGEKNLALTYYETGLPLSRLVGDRLGEARTLSNIGIIYSDRKDYAKALDYHREALPILKEIGDRLGESSTLNNMGLTLARMEDFDAALDYYQLALPISRTVGDRVGEATTLNNIGLVFEYQDQPEQALDYYSQALALYEATKDRSGEALVLFNIAYLEEEQENIQAALTTIKRALVIVEDLRTKVASPELRQTYFSTVQNYYNLQIRLLMKLHAADPTQQYDQQAFTASEKSRARTLIELLTESKTDVRAGISAEQLAEEEQLFQRLSQIEQVRIETYSDPFSTENEKETADINLAAANIVAQNFQTKIRQENPQYADLKYPKPLGVAELQQQILDDETVLLQYVFVGEQSYLWAITKDDFSSYLLPGSKRLNDAVNNARQYITNIKTGLPDVLQQRETQKRQRAIQELSELVLAPAAEHLNKKRIIVVADGNLHFLPFSILSLSGKEYRPIGDRHEIVNLPSASTISILRQNTIEPIRPDASLAVLADPVFHDQDCRMESNDPSCLDPQPNQKLDPRSDEDLNFLALKRSAKGFDDVNWDRLLGTRTEAKGIIGLTLNNTEILQAFDFEANRELMMGDRLKNYDLIHIATHGFLNTQFPELSGLVFSLVDKNENPQNGFLRINDVFNLKLNAGLIVLSACQTGLGDQIRGEGLVGLSRGFMYAGVPRVVVSLWQVDDAATAEFMTRFYRLLLQENLPAATALQRTQQEMRTETKWQHPYYWAAFILQGEWN
ncbi:MAG: CHAT domain-containing tetratricopeptide repeat protein [Limnothrix sp.]